MTVSQPIRPILFLGAGFSRNWGGWLATEAFEYLLGRPEIQGNDRLKKLLWKHQLMGGFEEALAEVQRHPGDSTFDADLRAFSTAILSMFDAMNLGFAEFPSFEFDIQIPRLIRTFMGRFEAIFSLNQDTLLEQHYLTGNVELHPSRRWNGWQIPGMRVDVPPPTPLLSRATGVWVPSGTYEVSPRLQPLFKLHGSSNWRDRANGSLLIMGGNKVASINANEVLSRYAKEFEAALLQPGARLMIIGYGFRDPHINKALHAAVESGLRFFVIDPRGSDLARSLNATSNFGAIYDPTPLEETFETGLIGASRRSLREIFGPNGAVEHSKVMHFFNP